MIRSSPLSVYSQARLGLFRAPPPGNRPPKSPRFYAYWTSQAGKGLVAALVWVVPVFTRQPAGQRCCRGRRRMLGLNDESRAAPLPPLRVGSCVCLGAAALLPLSRDTASASSHLPCFLASRPHHWLGFYTLGMNNSQPQNRLKRAVGQPFRLRIICAVEVIPHLRFTFA
jgi:hypothetical protein